MRPTLAVLSAQILLLSHLLPSIFANPLQLNLPTLLNSALLNTTTPSPVNPTTGEDFRCFEPGPRETPTTLRDCRMAAREMHTEADMQEYTFGRGNDVTYKLPRTFWRGTCVINIDMVFDQQTDRLTFWEVRETALALARRCTSDEPRNLGGIVTVEPNNVLYITVFGASSRGTS